MKATLNYIDTNVKFIHRVDHKSVETVNFFKVSCV